MKYILQWSAIFIVGLVIAAFAFFLTSIWFLINVVSLLWDFTFYKLELEEFIEIIADWVITEIFLTSLKGVGNDIRAVLIIFSGAGAVCSVIAMISTKLPIFGGMMIAFILSMAYNTFKLKTS